MTFNPSYIKYSSSVGFDNDIETFFTRISGKLICYDADSEEEYEAGKIEAYYLDLESASSNGYSPQELFDLDQDAYTQYETLFDPTTSELREDIFEKFGVEAVGYNWLIITRLEILPQFRGLKLGLAAISRTIQQYAHSCMLVSLEVVPLQLGETNETPRKTGWTAKMQMDSFTSDKNLAVQNLKSYYSHVGFREVDNCNLMLLNPAYIQPTLQEIGFE